MSQQELWASSCALESGVSQAAEPYTLQGYYDNLGNYIPGYYDEWGEYHLGYVYFDEDCVRHVVHGYYDPQGEWVDGALPEPPVGELERHTSRYFEAEGGDTLEVTMIWKDQVLSVHQFPEDTLLHIGPGEDNDYVVEHPSLPDATFPLISRSAGRYVLCFSPEMSGMFSQDGALHDLSALSKVTSQHPSMPGNHLIAFGPKCSARFDFGDVTLLLGFTQRSHIISGLGSFDIRPVPYIGASALAHVALLFLTFTMPPSADALSIDSVDIRDRYAALVTHPEQPEEEEEEPSLPSEVNDDKAASGHKGDEGEAGDTNAPPSNDRMAVAGNDAQIKFARDTKIASTSGALAALGSQPAAFGDADSLLGADALNALGALDGEEIGAKRGFGGMGLRGAGRGGPGDSESVGLKEGVTDGIGKKARRKARPDLGERPATVPQPRVVPGPVRTGNCMSKESIKKVIRQHRREIQYCYEKGLQRNPRLEGSVHVNMKIGPTGSVIAAKITSSTLKDATVESCIRTKIMRWNFAPPQGCALVNVNYPFRFRR